MVSLRKHIRTTPEALIGELRHLGRPAMDRVMRKIGEELGAICEYDALNKCYRVYEANTPLPRPLDWRVYEEETVTLTDLTRRKMSKGVQISGYETLFDGTRALYICDPIPHDLYKEEFFSSETDKAVIGKGADGYYHLQSYI